MNAVLAQIGLESWKPIIGALLLPPLPWLLLILLGARMLAWRRGLGWLTVLAGAAAIWLSQCVALGEWLQTVLVSPPPALTEQRIAAIRRDVAGRKPVAIVVLGGGRQPRAPEYGTSSLDAPAMERLRYGVWLSRETGAPVAYSGGIGHADADGLTEAEIAGRIAAQEFGRTLQWLESKSRDTRENGLRTVPLLRRAGVAEIVLVTHGWHMPRALRAFHEAAATEGARLTIVPAPMGLAPLVERPVLRWMPSSEGTVLVRHVLRETLARIGGA